LRTIAHISDLHFGRLNAATLPALVVVSGYLTQRAKTGEFLAARRFLDTLQKPQIIVPGNHDVPLYDVVSRWLAPLKKYRQYISSDLTPFFADNEIAVLGINTARSLTIKNGRINTDQVAHSCARLDGCPDGVSRVLVTHHPFDVAETGSTRHILGRAELAMKEFARCRIDLILAGHLHASRISDSTLRYKIPGYSALFIQAGTATSSRQRGELNSWNLIRIERGFLTVDCMSWDADRIHFAVLRRDRFQRHKDGWSKVGADDSVGQHAH